MSMEFVLTVNTRKWMKRRFLLQFTSRERLAWTRNTGSQTLYKRKALVKIDDCVVTARLHEAIYTCLGHNIIYNEYLHETKMKFAQTGLKSYLKLV